MSDIREKLVGLRNSCGAIASAIVSRDGVVVESDVPEGVYVETFAIMCATILGAAVTSSSELKKSNPESILISTADSKTYIVTAGKKALIVAVIEGVAPDDLVFNELKRIAALLPQ